MIEIFSGKHYSDTNMLGMSLGLILDFFSGWLGTLRALSMRINFRSLFFFGGGVGKRPMKSLCEAKRNKIMSVTSRLVKLQGYDQREEPNQFFGVFPLFFCLLVSSVQNGLEPISVFLFSCKCEGSGSNPFFYFSG
jgi:hypothetical protein